MAKHSLRFECRAARPVGKLAGRPVYRVPVIILHNDSRACATLVRREFEVLAHSAADAANWARDNECGNLAETEVFAFGPKGGQAYRYIGWHSSIANELARAWRAPLQADLWEGEE